MFLNEKEEGMFFPFLLGKGLGKQENGIAEALKVKIKCNTAGVRKGQTLSGRRGDLRLERQRNRLRLF